MKLRIRALVPDILSGAGAFFIIWGCYKIWQPAGFLALGGALIFAAVLLSGGQYE